MISKKDILTFGEKHRVLWQGNEFIYILPHPILRDYIANYTITFPTKEIMSERYTAMPDGSAALAVEFDTKNLSATMFGPATKPYYIGYNPSEMLVIIEFHPAGFYQLIGISQNELTDQIVSFETVNTILCKLLYEAIEKAKDIHELVTNLDNLLLSSMNVNYHPQIKLILQSIIDSAGNTTLKGLSNEINYSERQLSRIFSQHVGVSVKFFSRLVRVNNSFRLLQNFENSITLVSNTMGFHDLSHFIHDFNSLCGITPQEYRNNMSDFYSAIAKFSKYN